MCGIISVGRKEGREAYPIIMTGLKRLEYRGYDSHGSAVHGTTGVCVKKHLGAPSAEAWKEICVPGTSGVGHTRWATHGKVCEANTHPIAGGAQENGVKDSVWVVHNGVVENYLELKKELLSQHFIFKTETDTEVIAHLLYAYGTDAIKLLKGRMSFVAMWKDGSMLAVCLGSPMVITPCGLVASDPVALSGFADSYHSMCRGDYAVIRDGVKYYGERGLRDLAAVHPVPQFGIGDVYEDVGTSVMLREICEQADARRLKDGDHYREPSRYDWVLFGCGSSYNAALLGRLYLRIAGAPARVEYASEFQRDFESHRTRYVAITQSGETADTLRALDSLDAPWDRITVLCNRPDSSAVGLGRLLPMGCGPEYAVAATKSFTATCLRLYELAFGPDENRAVRLRGDIARVLRLSGEIRGLAAKLVVPKRNVLFMGSGLFYPVAREGALKMSEVAYKHSQAFPSAELKHGPLALVDDDTLCVFLLTDDELLPRVLGNVSEVLARGGDVLCLGFCFDIPDGAYGIVLENAYYETFEPLVANVALQLLAYHTANLLGINPDRPRALAKSVTV